MMPVVRYSQSEVDDDDRDDTYESDYLMDLLDRIDFSFQPILKAKVLVGVGSTPAPKDCVGVSFKCTPFTNSQMLAQPSRFRSQYWCEVGYKPMGRIFSCPGTEYIKKVAVSSKDDSLKVFSRAVELPLLPIFKFKIAAGLRFVSASSNHGRPFKAALQWSLSTHSKISGIHKLKKRIGDVEGRATSRINLSLPSFEGGMGQQDIELDRTDGNTDLCGSVALTQLALVWNVNNRKTLPAVDPKAGTEAEAAALLATREPGVVLEPKGVKNRVAVQSPFGAKLLNDPTASFQIESPEDSAVRRAIARAQSASASFMEEFQQAAGSAIESARRWARSAESLQGSPQASASTCCRNEPVIVVQQLPESQGKPKRFASITSACLAGGGSAGRSSGGDAVADAAPVLLVPTPFQPGLREVSEAVLPGLRSLQGRRDPALWARRMGPVHHRPSRKT